MSEQFLYEQLTNAFNFGLPKPEIPDCVTQNLNPPFELREYQTDAFARFIHCYNNDFPGKEYPLHLLFNMATGSSKTLIMALHTLSPFPEMPLSHTTINVAVMTPVIEDQHKEIEVSVHPVKTSHIQLIEIEDPAFLQKYTAYVTQKSSRWWGWIPEFPAFRYEEKTKKALIQTLTEQLHESLKARDKEWDKQIEEDIKAGKLDHLREKALEDIDAGKFTYL